MVSLYFSQIPDGYDVSDYPDNVEFVLDDSVRRRDPITFKLIPQEELPLVYPDECTGR